MAKFKINRVIIEETFCETFTAYVARILITSVNRKWALEAALEAKGLGRSATIPPSEASYCDICGNDIFRNSWEEVGIARHAFEPPPPMQGRKVDASAAAPAPSHDQEALIQAITDRVLEAIGQNT